MINTINQWNDAAELFAAEQERSEYAKINKGVIAKRFQDLSGKRLLDIGCGYGFYTDYFRSIGADAVGVDASEKMIEIARERYPLSEFFVADITSVLDFADSSADIVFCNQVLMDIPDIEDLFSECSRVLKDGGIFYWSIVHPAFYDCHWQKDENGYHYAKAVERYIEPYHFTNKFWDDTEHFHRPLSYYLNTASKYGFILKSFEEPQAYDGKIKNKDIPLFLFAEYRK